MNLNIPLSKISYFYEWRDIGNNDEKIANSEDYEQLNQSCPCVVTTNCQEKNVKVLRSWEW